jgi:hypothetical protein
MKCFDSRGKAIPRAAKFAAAIGGAVGLAFCLSSQPSKSQSSVGPAEDEMRVIRDQLQRQQLRHHDMIAPGEFQDLDRRPGYRNLRHRNYGR